MASLCIYFRKLTLNPIGSNITHFWKFMAFLALLQGQTSEAKPNATERSEGVLALSLACERF